MADITMCINTLCPIAGNCYRKTAISSEPQSIQLFKYKIGVNGVICDDYWPNYSIETKDRA